MRKTSQMSISTISLLGVAFVVLKLTGHITWSWIWVTLPFWGGIALVAAIVIIFLVLGLTLGKFR